MSRRRHLSICIVYVLIHLTPFAVAGGKARQLPVDGSVTSEVGWRLDPFGSGRMVYHRGVDIAVPQGTPVRPTRPGYVAFAGAYRGYGNLVAVSHGDGTATLYGHNSSITVRVGDEVTEDSIIALSGNTGRSTGPHVHYEIRTIAGFKERTAKLKRSLEEVVRGSVDRWVEGHVSGQGGDEFESYLPPDIDE
jgi:murein DD-endopeptidase MepM/ murein hydrolase activator NlpD